jgi:hypothetical protein
MVVMIGVRVGHASLRPASSDSFQCGVVVVDRSIVEPDPAQLTSVGRIVFHLDLFLGIWAAKLA